MNEKWFLLGVDQVEKKLKTNAASGLSRKAARSRINRSHGSVFYIPAKTPLRVLSEILSDFAWIMLLLTAIVALCFEEYRSVLAVLILLIVNILAAWFLCYRGEKTGNDLAAFFSPMARVVRKGHLFLVDHRSVVPGDVILLEKGDILCCDARLVTSDRLKVNMKLDHEREMPLDKLAEAPVLPKTYLAQDMVNMVHAGSVVVEGSGRAIVTAVGKYTYIGAMTGGIPLPSSNRMPTELKRFRKHCSKINMILLVAVLPFSLLSLLFSHIGGGSVLLSASFLTGLSLVATTLSQLSCTLSSLFFLHQSRRLLRTPNAAVVRSAEAMERMESADYVFLLDGCALTDGILHFSSAICADGEVRNYQKLTPNAIFLSELVSLYHTAAGRMPTAGISGAGDYFTGIGEFVRKSGVDEGALRIRYTIDSYRTGDLSEASEQVVFHDRETKSVLQVSCSASLIDQCGTAMIGGRAQPLSEEGRAALKKLWGKATAMHGVPVIFAVSSNCSSNERCFAGMLVLREGFDSKAKQTVAYLEKSGYKVITFVGDTNNAPKIPLHVLEQTAISKQEFEKRRLPLTYRFGQLSCYADFSQEDIRLLIDEIHRRKQKVLILGFTEDAGSLSEYADGFITCSSTNYQLIGRLTEELQVSELEGQQYSISCMQTVKQKADCLISRPTNEKGGLSSLVTVLGYVKNAYRNFSDFIRYLVSVSMMRALIVSIPMILGKTVLDARHVLFFGCVMDAVALMMFMHRRRPQVAYKSKNYSSVEHAKDYFWGDRPMLFAGLAASISTFLFPELLGMLSFAGLYHDKTEFSFVALIFLHITALYLIYSGSQFKNVLKNKILWGELSFLLLFLILCFTWEPFGGFFGIQTRLSIPYLLFSLFPSVVYGSVMLLLSRREKRRA